MLLRLEMLGSTTQLQTQNRCPVLLDLLAPTIGSRRREHKARAAAGTGEMSGMEMNTLAAFKHRRTFLIDMNFPGLLHCRGNGFADDPDTVFRN
jgi:hypothetical protein